MEKATRQELIEKLAMVEVSMDIVRRRIPDEVESLEMLLNSVDEMNALGMERDEVRGKLDSL